MSIERDVLTIGVMIEGAADNLENIADLARELIREEWPFGSDHVAALVMISASLSGLAAAVRAIPECEAATPIFRDLDRWLVPAEPCPEPPA